MMHHPEDFNDQLKKATTLANSAIVLIIITSILFIFLIVDPSLSIFQNKEATTLSQVDEDRIENGIHVRTGFIEGKGLREVINNCTNCHSAKLVIQNRMNEERWNATITWMQETQNLWDLGENQKVIVDYLVTNYPIQEKNRRENLTNISWYEITD